MTAEQLGEDVQATRETGAPSWSGSATAAPGANGQRLIGVVWPDGVTRYYTDDPAA